MFTGYPPMAFYLEKTGRPMILSCEYPTYELGASLKVSQFSNLPNFTFSLWCDAYVQIYIKTFAEKYSLKTCAEKYYTWYIVL